LRFLVDVFLPGWQADYARGARDEIQSGGAAENAPEPPTPPQPESQSLGLGAKYLSKKGRTSTDAS
jgi:hypothetical protein